MCESTCKVRLAWESCVVWIFRWSAISFFLFIRDIPNKWQSSDLSAFADGSVGKLFLAVIQNFGVCGISSREKGSRLSSRIDCFLRALLFVCIWVPAILLMFQVNDVDKGLILPLRRDICHLRSTSRRNRVYCHNRRYSSGRHCDGRPKNPVSIVRIATRTVVLCVWIPASSSVRTKA